MFQNILYYYIYIYIYIYIYKIQFNSLGKIPFQESARTLVLTNPTGRNCQNYFEVWAMVTGGKCSVFRKY